MYENVEVLLVEDNSTDAELTLRALENHNLHKKVHRVANGEQALDFLFHRGEYKERRERLPLKAVFLDLKIPRISGLDVLKEIKSNESTRQIPVVIISSSSHDVDAEEAYALGANGYVVKPVSFEDFSKVIGDTGLFWLKTNESPKG